MYIIFTKLDFYRHLPQFFFFSLKTESILLCRMSHTMYSALMFLHFVPVTMFFSKWDRAWEGWGKTNEILLWRWIYDVYKYVPSILTQKNQKLTQVGLFLNIWQSQSPIYAHLDSEAFHNLYTYCRFYFSCSVSILDGKKVNCGSLLVD